MAQPTFEQLFQTASRSSVHLEMRDAYMLDDPAYRAWQNGRVALGGADEVHWRGLVRSAVDRGVEVRRARIVSEPLSDYTRFEYDITEQHNIAAGEQVRWLPRRRATALALPGNDFWLFDDEVLLINHFAGNGDWTDTEIVDDAEAVKLCATAFEAVWVRAAPHADYRPG
ncbi:DUF6879 family protein [Kitasatospora sp. NPDC058170]|uniref:DUF6879 family protein n=1 Tax=Kitasatospora sp. NPDC058170 TaxID=3346364 RepID=UPI0036D8E466